MKEVVIASAMVGGIFSVVVLIALAHRAGRITWLQSIGDFAGRQLNLPAWAAFPSTVLVTSLISAVFGLYWDISLHLSKGRDPGPLANPSHYFILLGLLGCFSAGVFAMTMPKPGTKPSPSDSGARPLPNESVVPVSNQHSDPAEIPVITTPASQA